jgi:hypothetical protein
MWEYAAWVELGKLFLFKDCMGAQRYIAIFKKPSSFGCTVGQTPDIVALYWTLSEEPGLKPELNVNPEDYKLKLHSQFRQKRVFLVLDDVWQDKAFDTLDLAKEKGSVTLLTTRTSLYWKEQVHR